MSVTISRRQNKLYHERGFDPRTWEALVEEGNALRKEIKMIADEYDVDWDEKLDEEMSDKVRMALKKDRKVKRGERKEAKKEEDEDDND